MTINELMQKHQIIHGIETDQAHIDTFKKELLQLINNKYVDNKIIYVQEGLDE